MNEDIELARRYAIQQSEQAFETLVSRYLGLVHSAALRQVRDPQLAEEITQTVFVILARKAGSLSSKTILPGWLYKTTRYVASAALKMQYRRERREQEAQMQTTTQEPQADSIWPQLAPLLDEAMAQLREKDRDTLVLRFFQNKSLREVGAAFGMNEYAAQKRVARGLEKLRVIFEKRGISTSTGAISGTIAANSIQTVPVLLAKSVTAAAITKGMVSSTSTLTLMKGALKIMAWSKTKTAIIAGVIVLLAAGTGMVAVKEIQKQRHKSQPQQHLTGLSPVIKISPNGTMSVISASQLKALGQSSNSNRSYGKQVSSFGFKMGSSRDAILQQLEQIHATILTNSSELLCAEPEKTPTMKKSPPEMDFSFTNEKLTRVTFVISRATNAPDSPLVQIQ
jgi:RNA polymerase sigma factor (sigma-70 family)